MAFVSSALQLSTLYNPLSSGDLTQTAWATQLGTNISNYFMAGTTTPYNDGTYTYTQIPPLVTIPATIIADLISLYTNTSKTAAEWGNDLGTIIADWWGTVTYNGIKVLNVTPFTSTSWNGTVSSSLAKVYLIANLTPNYIPATTPSTYTAFATSETTIIDTAAKMCYLQFPSNLLS